MSAQDNTHVGRTFFDNINAHTLDKNISVQADDVQTEAPGVPGPMNLAQYQAYVQNFITAFPDLHFEIARTVAEDDFVVLQWIGRGTNDGPLLAPSGATIPATGKQVAVPGTSTLEIKNGKITRNWVAYDMLAILGPLGLLPPA